MFTGSSVSLGRLYIKGFRRLISVHLNSSDAMSSMQTAEKRRDSPGWQAADVSEESKHSFAVVS